MELDFNKTTQRLTVRLSDSDAQALLEGSSLSGEVSSRAVVVHPLSDIDPDSRQTEPKDGARVKKKLGEITSQATVMDSQTIVYVAESLTENRQHIAAEEISPSDISGNHKLRPQGGIRIEFK